MKHKDAFPMASLSEKKKEVADILLDALDASSLTVDEMEEPFFSMDMYKVVEVLINVLGSAKKAKVFVKKVNLWWFFHDITRECYDRSGEFLSEVVSGVLAKYQEKEV